MNEKQIEEALHELYELDTKHFADLLDCWKEYQAGEMPLHTLIMIVEERKAEYFQD